MAMRWESVHVGTRVGELDKGPISTSHIMRWSAAVENFHRIHYDHPFATGHDKLPDVLINGSWKQHVLVQLAKDALGPEGWLWRMKFRYRKMDVAGDRIRGFADVIATQEVDGLGFATLRVTLVDQNEAVSTAGFAIGVLPLPGGVPVPYPFVPRPAYDAVTFPADD
jgi:acyl dehydratase